MKRLLWSLMLLAALNAQAQERKWEHRFSLGAGITAEREDGSTDNGLALRAGYALAYNLSEQWSLMAGLAIRDVSENTFGDAMDGADDDHFTFLDLPLVARYHVGQGKGSWALGLGPVLSYCIGNDTYYIDNVRVTKVSDKAFFWKDLLYAGVFNRGDERTIYNVIYRDGKGPNHYAKRFAITSVTRDKDYDITPGADGTRILWFTVNHNGEAESVRIQFRPKKGLKKTSMEWDFTNLAIKGRGSRGNLVTKNPVARIQLKSKGVTTLEGKDIWWDPDIQRLNEEGRGQHLGKFAGQDKVLAIFADGTYYTTSYDLVNKYQGDVVRIEKFDPSRIYSVLYWDNGAKAFYVKRFNFAESNNTPVLFIADARGSRLVDISSDLHPQMVLTFGGKFGHREAETVDVEEFIAKKGLTAKGKKCSSMDLKSVAFGEPLHKEEDDLPAQEAEIAGAPDEEEPIEMEFQPDEPIEQLGQAADLLKGSSEEPAGDDAADFGTWEPTLF